MFTVTLIFIFIACFALIFFVLIQSPKGNALGGGGFASQASNIIGVQRTGDVLEKITWGTIGFIIIFCLLSTFLMPKGKETEEIKSRSENVINNAPVTAPAKAPAAPANAPATSGTKPATAPATKPADNGQKPAATAPAPPKGN
jgi:preprotein translocase subunit SecG